MATFAIIIGCSVVGFLLVSLAIDVRRNLKVTAGQSADKPARPPWSDVLGVSTTASLDEVRAAYAAKAAAYNPETHDKLGPELRSLVERRIKELNEAYADALEQLSR